MTDTDTATPPDAPPEAAPKRRSRRLLVIGIVVLLVIGGVLAYLFVFGGDDAGAGEPPADESAAAGEIVELETLTTVTATEGRLARVGLAIVAAEGTGVAPVEARLPMFEDAAVRALARMDADRLKSADGADDLRVQLSEDAAEIWPDDTVLRALITELVVQ